MADFLPGKKNLTVVTNNMPLINRLCGTGITVYCCGGDFVESSSSFVGGLAVEVLEQFNFHMAFITCTALSPGGMLARNSVHSAYVLRTALRRSRCGVFLLDREKIGRYAACNFADINTLDCVITDDERQLQGIRPRVIRV